MRKQKNRVCLPFLQEHHKTAGRLSPSLVRVRAIVALLLGRDRDLRAWRRERTRDCVNCQKTGDEKEGKAKERTLSSIRSNAVQASSADLRLLTLLTIGSSTPALTLSRTSPLPKSRP